MNLEISTDRAHIYAPPTSFSGDHAADIIEVDAAASGFTFDPAANSRRCEIAALSFDFHQVHVARDVDHEFAGRAPRPAAFPLADHPCGISAHVNADLVGIEFAARFLL